MLGPVRALKSKALCFFGTMATDHVVTSQNNAALDLITVKTGFGFAVQERQLLRQACCAISLIAGLQALLLVATWSRVCVSGATFDVRLCLNYTASDRCRNRVIKELCVHEIQVVALCRESKRVPVCTNMAWFQSNTLVAICNPNRLINCKCNFILTVLIALQTLRGIEPAILFLVLYFSIVALSV